MKILASHVESHMPPSSTILVLLFERSGCMDDPVRYKGKKCLMKIHASHIQVTCLFQIHMFLEFGARDSRDWSNARVNDPPAKNHASHVRATPHKLFQRGRGAWIIRSDKTVIPSQVGRRKPCAGHTAFAKRTDVA